MKVIKRDEFRALEKYNIEDLGIDPSVIVENAALKVMSHIDLDLRHSFAVVCGVSKNGAYGLALARNLIAEGKYVDIYIVENINEANKDFKIQHAILEKVDANIYHLETIGQLQDFSKDIHRVNTIIDAITGIEFEKSFQGPAEFIIDAINRSRIYTISIDIPSGTDYDTGHVQIVSVQPDLVVTFEGLKEGLVENNQGLHKYRIVVENIGLIRRDRHARH